MDKKDRASDASVEYRIADLVSVINCLDEKYREPILMKYKEQLSTTEIAEALGITENLVYQRISRGKENADGGEMMDFEAVLREACVEAERITLNCETVSLKVGESTRLIATITPENTTGASVVWTSDNEAVALVDITGNIIALSAGIATITASIANSELEAKCSVNVESSGLSYTLTYDANKGVNPPSIQKGSGNILLSNNKPTREGYIFLGWATSESATSPQYQPGASYDLIKDSTLYAVWKENDTPLTPDDPTADAKLNVKSSATVDYRSIVTVTATATGVPDGYVLAIFDGNTELARGDNKSVSYKVGEMKSGRTFTVKVIDANGNVQKDSSGAELSKTCEVKVNGGFFKRLIAFFKGLFKHLPNIEIKP